MLIGLRHGVRTHAMLAMALEFSLLWLDRRAGPSSHPNLIPPAALSPWWGPSPCLRAPASITCPTPPPTRPAPWWRRRREAPRPAVVGRSSALRRSRRVDGGAGGRRGGRQGAPRSAPPRAAAADAAATGVCRLRCHGGHRGGWRSPRAPYRRCPHLRRRPPAPPPLPRFGWVPRPCPWGRGDLGGVPPARAVPPHPTLPHHPPRFPPPPPPLLRPAS